MGTLLPQTEKEVRYDFRRFNQLRFLSGIVTCWRIQGWSCGYQTAVFKPRRKILLTIPTPYPCSAKCSFVGALQPLSLAFIPKP